MGYVHDNDVKAAAVIPEIDEEDDLPIDWDIIHQSSSKLLDPMYLPVQVVWTCVPHTTPYPNPSRTIPLPWGTVFAG